MNVCMWVGVNECECMQVSSCEHLYVGSVYKYVWGVYECVNVCAHMHTHESINVQDVGDLAHAKCSPPRLTPSLIYS